MTSTLEILNAANIQFLRNYPLFITWQTSTQSIATGTPVALTWPAAQVDTYTGWSVSNPTRYTGKVGGYYEFNASYASAANATGDHVIFLVKNGVTASPIASTAVTAASASDNPSIQVSAIIQLNGSTDYVEAWVVQRSGGALVTAVTLTSMNAIMIHE
jgi:hypothetical protein